MRVLALDLSLTSTGAAHSGGTSRITPKSRGVDRLADIRTLIADLVRSTAPEVVVLEGYAFGARGRAMFNIGELGGVVRLLLFDMGIPFVEVPPSCLKLFATGKGNSGKDAVLECAIRSFGFEGHGNDEADAWMLLKIAEAHYGDGGTNEAQRKALAGVKWV